MERVRQNVTIFCYQLGHIRNGLAKLNDYLSTAKSETAKYDALLEELHSERTAVLNKLQYESDISISDVKKDIDKAEGNLSELEKHSKKFKAELNSALKKYAQLKEEAAKLLNEKSETRSDREKLRQLAVQKENPRTLPKRKGRGTRQ